MNRFAWLVRREFWEHRAIWVAPAIVLAVLLFGAVTGNIFMGDVVVNSDGSSLSEEQKAALKERLRHAESIEDLDELGRKLDESGELDDVQRLSAGEALALVPAEKQVKLVKIVYMGIAAVMFLVLSTIGFFYALDALYSDRRDRSVLFWKSLPLSDAETVLAKFAVGAVAIPVVAAVAAVAGQLVVATGLSLKLAFLDGNAAMLWAPSVILPTMASTGVITVASVLWYAPMVAYLLLASAWAPKSPFLWAVLPPLAVVMLEKIAFGTTVVGKFLSFRSFGVLKALAGDESGVPGVVVNEDNFRDETVVRMSDLTSGVVDLMLSPSMLLGLVAAAVLLAAAIWVRRYRDESI